jgi:hypothetical protein
VSEAQRKPQTVVFEVSENLRVLFDVTSRTVVAMAERQPDGTWKQTVNQQLRDGE